MPRIEKEDTQRVHLYIYARDYNRLKLMFADSIGMSRAVRNLIRQFLDHTDQKALRTAKHPPLPDDIDEILEGAD